MTKINPTNQPTELRRTIPIVSTKQLVKLEIDQTAIYQEKPKKNAAPGAYSQAYAHRAGITITTKACIILIPKTAEAIKAVIVTRTT